MTDYIIITNNPKVKDYFEDYKPNYSVDYIEYDPKVGYRACLERTREYLHKGGYKLETHPLSGSVKPNETPYKSMIVSVLPQGKYDMDGTMIMEDSMETFDKFRSIEPVADYVERILEDFREIDYSLIKGAIERMRY